MFDIGSGARLAAGVLALVLAVGDSALSAREPPDPPKVQTLIINKDHVRCRIQKYNDDYIWIIPVFGDVELEPMRLDWSALDPGQVKEIRGEERRASAIDDLMKQGGDMVEALRIRLKNKKTFIGLELRERSTDEELVVRRSSIPEARYPREDIASTEVIMLPMTEFYSKDEIYLMKMAEMNPATARDHVALAEEMMKVGNWAKAIEHFERARILDEDFIEPTEERIAEAKAAKVKDDVKAIDQKIRSDYRGRRWKSCLERIDRLSAFDPDSHIRTSWDAKRAEIVANLQKDLRRQIVSSFYRTMTDLVTRRATGLVSEGEIPGVVVTTRRGEAVTGTLVSDDDEFVVIESEGKTLRIAKSLVTQVKLVDLARKTRYATFAEAKDYVTDTSGGITADILKALEEEYGKYGTPDNPVTQQTIKEMWDNRLTWVITYTERGITKTGRVYSFHEAEYKTGTWLREGSAIAAGGDGDAAGGGVETDPEKWWKAQSFDLRSEILRAIAAEALCDVQKVVQKRCPGCGGTGTKKWIHGLASGKVSTAASVCPICRGTGSFVKIRYR